MRGVTAMPREPEEAGSRWPHLDLHEASLWQRRLNGDPAARHDLVELHLGLVHSAAARFAGSFPWDPSFKDDLVQAGVVGLLKAVDGFDPRRGHRFATYAVPFILGEMRRFIRSQQPVRAAGDLADLARRAEAAREVLRARHGREPTAHAVARYLQVDVARVLEAQEALRRPASLDDLAGLADPGEGPAAVIHRLDVEAMLLRLPPRMRRLLALRYAAGRTQQETAAALGLSQGQVSRLERQALDILRRAAGSGQI